MLLRVLGCRNDSRFAHLHCVHILILLPLPLFFSSPWKDKSKERVLSLLISHQPNNCFFICHVDNMTVTKLPPFNGVSPRVTAETISSHRGNYVSIIFELTGPGEFRCGVTGKTVRVDGLPDSTEVSKVCEFVGYVDPSSGHMQYFQHALLDDEFDFEVYRRLLNLIPKYPELF
ncbi:hypothetical protein STCU_01071 [Strigomonas culicis]|uniref:Replication factor A protein 3 n=1 Tax=Strigomonas culicis TaxID=28005 RepID=S9V3V9_9TRYP|nr:hypothetical protein STCU_01071 [Strigomonas culicis]|eukprot:EPY35603.1 hypothetical protein STCU_01071 [Strigomonas culicis]